MINRPIYITLIFSLFCVAAFAQSEMAVDSVFLDEIEYEYIPADDNFDFIGDRLSCLEQEIPLNYNNNVHSFITHFLNRDRAFTDKIIKRKEFFFPVFEEYLAKYELPDELKYLSIIESGLNPRAISRARAVGLWQFMSYTGMSYGLHQDNYIDERMDFERSTEAACKYLASLYKMFGDWELALAAYNSGPGNVRKAMRRSGKKKFWEMYRYLPRETRGYVPQFVAVIYVMNYLEEYGFSATPENYYVEYDTVMLKEYAHIPTLAGMMNLCPEDILDLNTGLKFNAFPDIDKSYPLRLPQYSMEQFQENRDQYLDSAAKIDKSKVKLLAGNTGGSTYGKNRIVYKVRNGDVLGTIAQRYRVRVSDLRQWNNLRGDMIRVGQRLNIWVRPGSTKTTTPVVVAKKKSPPAPKITLPPGTGTTYIVQPGDTLWDIAKKFNGVTIERIKAVNGLNSDSIKPGQKLKIG